MIAVARHQHDDAPVVDILQVDGEEARRSLERTSVVSIITSRPIHASGIFPSESEALGLSLSIIASSFDSTPPASVG